MMRKTVWTFGLASGALAAALMMGTIPFMAKPGGWGVLVGTAGMVLSFLLVFFGVRALREREGGVITFSRALTAALLMVLISSTCYVATWEANYFGRPGFAERFDQMMIEATRAKGGPDVEKIVQQQRDFQVTYHHPVANIALTFLEPLPVGVLMALASALILRRRGAPGGS